MVKSWDTLVCANTAVILVIKWLEVLHLHLNLVLFLLLLFRLINNSFSVYLQVDQVTVVASVYLWWVDHWGLRLFTLLYHRLSRLWVRGEPIRLRHLFVMMLLGDVDRRLFIVVLEADVINGLLHTGDLVTVFDSHRVKLLDVLIILTGVLLHNDKGREAKPFSGFRLIQEIHEVTSVDCLLLVVQLPSVPQELRSLAGGGTLLLEERGQHLLGTSDAFTSVNLFVKLFLTAHQGFLCRNHSPW